MQSKYNYGQNCVEKIDVYGLTCIKRLYQTAPDTVMSGVLFLALLLCNSPSKNLKVVFESRIRK